MCQAERFQLIFAKFVATDPAWQVDLSTGLPGYGPEQDPWLAKLAADKYFADIPTTQAAFKAAAGAVAPYSYMLYDTGSVWTETVSPALIAGKTVDDAIKAFGDELVNKAKSIGYTVKESK